MPAVKSDKGRWFIQMTYYGLNMFQNHEWHIPVGEDSQCMTDNTLADNPWRQKQKLVRSCLLYFENRPFQTLEDHIKPPVKYRQPGRTLYTLCHINPSKNIYHTAWRARQHTFAIFQFQTFKWHAISVCPNICLDSGLSGGPGTYIT